MGKRLDWQRAWKIQSVWILILLLFTCPEVIPKEWRSWWIGLMIPYLFTWFSLILMTWGKDHITMLVPKSQWGRWTLPVSHSEVSGTEGGMSVKETGNLNLCPFEERQGGVWTHTNSSWSLEQTRGENRDSRTSRDFPRGSAVVELVSHQL